MCSFISKLCIMWPGTLKLVTHKIIYKISNMPLQVCEGIRSHLFAMQSWIVRAFRRISNSGFFLLFLWYYSLHLSSCIWGVDWARPVQLHDTEREQKHRRTTNLKKKSVFTDEAQTTLFKGPVRTAL